MEVGIVIKEGERREVKEKVKANEINVENENIIDTSSQRERVK